jgi:hypothetical protein
VGEEPAVAPQAGPPTTVEGRAPGGGGVFGPTQRPGEPVTAGTYPTPVQGFGNEELSADDIIREMYAKRPSPWLLRLMRG